MGTAIVERLRETIEHVMPRQQAAASMFAALGRFGSRVPADEAELAVFVRGALREELARVLEPASLATLMRELDDVLATVEAPTADRAIPIVVGEVEEARPPWGDEPTTASIRAVDGPVPVLVIARSGSLASRLRMSLGVEVIDVDTRADLPGIERSLGASPVIAIVDARDTGAASVEALATALVRSKKTTSIVWGSDSPYGRSVLEAVEASGGAIAGIDTSEGVGAILDLVISRRA